MEGNLNKWRPTARAVALTAALLLPQFALAQASPFLTGANSLQSNILAWLTPVAVILIMVLGGMAMANRIVLFALWKDSTAWVRACPTEGLVIFEAMKILRDAPQVAPLKIEMMLLLEPALRQRVIQTLTSQHVTPSGKA
jgi:TrbC/VIRB2 pilin